MSKNEDFTVDELYNFIRTDQEYSCGLDEVLMLMAEYIDDERIIKEVDKYVEAYYEDIGLR